MRARAARAAAMLACAAMLAGAAAAKPYRPDSAEMVLERVPAAAEGAALRRMRAALAAKPDDLAAAVALATRYIELGRVRGDPRLYGHAEAVLGPWYADPDPPPQVRLLRATVYQHRHDFERALADLEALLRVRPRNPQAWLTRALILQARGEPQASLASCIASLRLGLTLQGTACVAIAASLTGDGGPARHALAARQALAARHALARGLDRYRGAPAAARLWAHTVAAELAARAGDPAAADEQFQAALAMGLDDRYLLAAYADHLLDQGREREARALLREHTTDGGLLMRLAIAERRLGLPDHRRRGRELAALHGALERRGEAGHLRDRARAALVLFDRPAEALGLALRNWETHREPWDARLVLEAAAATGEPEAAEPVLRWMDRTGIADPRLRELAGRLQEGDRA